jgi:tetratricopeptide (TPR) repeat protein
LANLRTAFRWAADCGDLDVAATIATYAAFLGFCIDNYEPIAWAEELIESARAVDHPRLAFLYVIASQCYTSGRIEEAVRYSQAGMAVVESGRGEVPFGIEGLLFIAYLYAGQPELAVDWCRSRVQSGRDTHTVLRTWLIMSLTVAQTYEEAIAATAGLIEAAEATGNPWVLSLALFGFGAALGDADPVGALEACRRGLQVAEDSGNRGNGTTLATVVARIEGEYGDSLRALHYIAVAIHNYHDSGNPTYMRIPMATLATILDRVGRYEPAATIAGCASTPLAVATYPELSTTTAHLRTVLGDEQYESLARKGETMSTAELATYAYDQIDHARAELERPS